MKATDKIWKKVMGDADQTLFTDVQPLLKKLDEADKVIAQLDKVIAQLKIDLANEKANRTRYQGIVYKLCNFIDRGMVTRLSVQGDSLTTVENVAGRLEAFETALHAMLLGINPKEKQ